MFRPLRIAPWSRVASRIRPYIEAAHLLADEAEQRLAARGFTHDQVLEWARRYEAAGRNGSVGEFIAWIDRREHEGAGVVSTDVPRPGRRVPYAAFVVSIVALALVLAVIAASVMSIRNDRVATAATRPVRLVRSREEPTSVAADVIRRVLPSVVNVRVTSVAVDPFNGARTAPGEGSGAIVSPDGVIVTNEHVVAGAVDVTVAFTDGRASMKGTVPGSDPAHDRAVIKFVANGLRPVMLGRSSGLRLGETTYAIGFPLGLGATATNGIVSGLDRAVQSQGEGRTEHLVGLLQTDAAIDPGNSGGGLFDATGHLIGINTAAVQAGAAENVGSRSRSTRRSP